MFHAKTMRLTDKNNMINSLRLIPLKRSAGMLNKMDIYKKKKENCKKFEI